MIAYDTQSNMWVMGNPQVTSSEDPAPSMPASQSSVTLSLDLRYSNTLSIFPGYYLSLLSTCFVTSVMGESEL